MKKFSGLFWFGVAWMTLLILLAIFVPMFKSYETKIGLPFEGPGPIAWLGTDEKGYDVFARLAYGARMSLLVGIGVQVSALAIGLFLGISAVYGPKWIRVIILRLTDAMFAFPDILLAILIIGIFNDRGIRPVIIALTVTAWPGIVRLVKTQAATMKDREFVVASQALGASTWYTVTRHIIPHLWGILLAVIMVELAGTILAESTLSFLGIGIQPPTPSWGSMIYDARGQMTSNPMLLLGPCIVLSLTIFALNFIGDGLRSRFQE
jgi:ABC-type dipeptide/oligopeptide/nickel transport system permease subunit